MNCPRCQPQDCTPFGDGATRVVETRKAEHRHDIPQVKRRRECKSCTHRFTTIERIVSGAVLMPGGKRTPFSSQRLTTSLERLGSDCPTEQERDRLVEGIKQRLEAQLDSIDLDTLVGWVAGALPPSARVRYLEVVRQLDQESAQRIAEGEVVKRDGQVSWFNREKLHESLTRAVHNFLSPEELQALIDSIEQEVVEASHPVKTEQIRRTIEERLENLNALAGLRYSAGASNAAFAQLLQRITHAEHGHVVKKNGRLEPFEPRKLARSIKLAFGKRSAKEAVADSIDRFVEQLACDLAKSSESAKTSEIGDRVLAWLKEHDQVAFVSYIVLYRDLHSHELLAELRNWGIPI